MTRWYRAYVGTVSDDKIAEVALVAATSCNVASPLRSAAIAVWHALLESAAADQAQGSFSTTSRRIAATLCEPIAVVDAVMTAMSEVGMLEGSSIAAWKKRQYESDRSTERSRASRERRRNVAATLQQRDAAAPETETDTEAEKEVDAHRAMRSRLLADLKDKFEFFWGEWPNKVGKPQAFRSFAKVAREVDAIVAGVRRYVVSKPPDRPWLNPATFLNQRRWEDAPAAPDAKLAASVEDMQAMSNKGKTYTMRDSKEGEVLEQIARERTGKGRVWDKRGGWWVDNVDLSMLPALPAEGQLL